MRAHFGLGNASIIDSIKIEWPLGIIEYFTNVNTNQFVQYIEGATSTSITQKNNNAIDFSVYPNPNSGSFVLQLKNTLETGEFILMNTLGQKVYEQKITQQQTIVQTKNLSKGIYTYTIMVNKQKLGNGKLVIE